MDVSWGRGVLVGVALAACACSEERDASGRFEVVVTNTLWPQPVKLLRDGEPLGEVRGRQGRFEFAGHARQALTAVTLTTEGWHGVQVRDDGPGPDALVERLAKGGAPVRLIIVTPDLAALGAATARVGVDGRDAPEAEVAVGQLPLPRSTGLERYRIWAPSSPAPIRIGGVELGKLPAGDSAAVVDVSGAHCYRVRGVAYSTGAVAFGSDYDRRLEPARLHDRFETRVDYVFEDAPSTITVRTNGAPWTERVVYQLGADECPAPPPKKKRR